MLEEKGEIPYSCCGNKWSSNRDVNDININRIFREPWWDHKPDRDPRPARQIKIDEMRFFLESLVLPTTVGVQEKLNKDREKIS